MTQAKPRTLAKNEVAPSKTPPVQTGDIGAKHAAILPSNCFVVPMMILDPPEPIKRRPKNYNGPTTG
jgi:hypothetical protein